MHYFETDVLTIGGGGGGAMAAYEASKHGVGVTLVMKGRPQRCGSTIMAPGAFAGVGDWHVPGDSRDIHFADTVKGGAYMGEQRLVRLMVEETPGLIVEMERIGALWQREEDGKTYSLRIDGGHSFHRCPYLEDRTGREMLRTLFGVLKKRNVHILTDIMVLKLLKEGDRVCGAVGLDMATCEPVLVKARTVIIACGGAGNLYWNTDSPTGVTGDGYALALEAGAALMDMEFVQFYPLGFCFPDSLRGALGGLHYYLHLLNKNGERFMERYDPQRLELSTRDRVARAMVMEIKEGRGGPHGGVFGDMTFHERGYIQRMQPALCETYSKFGVDPEKDYVELAPTCHFFMGGIKVDENWRSTVPGLFVVGESGTGIQGANRLSQNALAELLVSGHRSGKSAALYAKGADLAAIDPKKVHLATSAADAMLQRKNGVRPVALRNRLRHLMWEKVGVFRSAESLEDAAREVAEIKIELEHQALNMSTRRYNQELAEGLENYFMVTTGECVIAGALKRTESRGAHFREDYPKSDNDNWLQHLVLQSHDHQLHMEEVPVDLREIRPEREIQ